MKNFNWLVKIFFYKHTEKQATKKNTPGDANSIFYDVGYIDQQHANLCTAASENMLYHFARKPIATMQVNPRGILEGAEPNHNNFESICINIKEIPNLLIESGPFIFSLPLKYDFDHSVVAVGFSKNELIYHDPLTGSNKKLSIEELKKLTKTTRIGIDLPNFFTADHLKNRSKDLNDHPVNIATKKYARFFTLDKMSDEKNQCQAIKNFLADYAKNSLWTLRRNHKEKVRDFLNKNQDVENLDTLLENMERTLIPINKQGELLKRLLTVKKMCGKIKSGEIAEQEIAVVFK